MLPPRTNNLSTPTIASVCLSLAVFATLGCASKGDGWKFAKSWDMRRAVGLKSDDPEPAQLPTRLVTTWSDTVLHRQGQPPQRGFGGRLNFFGHDSQVPVRVDGQLVVYAFDETDREPHETAPSRRFIFPREQFARHESESKLGPSYSVWLPWDAVGGERKNISLIARFEPHGGPLIVSEQTQHLLPGTVMARSKQTSTGNEIRLAQHDEALSEKPTVVRTSATAPATHERNRSTSIPLPKHWERILLKSRDKSSATETAPSEAAPPAAQW